MLRLTKRSSARKVEFESETRTRLRFLLICSIDFSQLRVNAIDSRIADAACAAERNQSGCIDTRPVKAA